jgi:hypothetical protein
MYKATIGVVLGTSKTGLTLSAQLVAQNGSNTGSLITGGFVEIGAGNYMWTYEQFPQNFRGGVKFLSAGSLMAFVTVNPELLEYVDAPISSRLTSAIKVPTFSIPTAADEGTPVELRVTDDYFAAEGRAIDVTNDTWPSLAESIVRLSINSRRGGFREVLPVLAGNIIRIEFSRAELNEIGVGRWSFEISTTLTNNHNLTLLTGYFNVRSPFTG